MVIARFADDPIDAIEHALSIEVQASPDAAALGAGDVVIAVESAAVGWVDLLMTSGQYQHMPTPPYTPGLEYSGRVVWAGPSVRRFAVGG